MIRLNHFRNDTSVEVYRQRKDTRRACLKIIISKNHLHRQLSYL